MLSTERIQVQVPAAPSVLKKTTKVMLRPLVSTDLVSLSSSSQIRICPVSMLMEKVKLLVRQIPINRCKSACLFNALKIAVTLDWIDNDDVLQSVCQRMGEKLQFALEEEHVLVAYIVEQLDIKWTAQVVSVMSRIVNPTNISFDALEDVAVIRKIPGYEDAPLAKSLTEALNRSRELCLSHPTKQVIDHTLMLTNTESTSGCLSTDWVNAVQERVDYVYPKMPNVETCLDEVLNTIGRQNYTRALKYVQEYRNAKKCKFAADICGHVHRIADDFSLHQST